MDYIIFNIDNGDLFHLGKIVVDADSSSGLERATFENLASRMAQSIRPDLRDFWDKQVDLISFFLANSVGCRLIIVSEDDFEEICDEALQEEKKEGRLLEAVVAIALPSDYRNDSVHERYGINRLQTGDAFSKLLYSEYEKLEVRHLIREQVRKGLVFHVDGLLKGAAVYSFGRMQTRRFF